MNHRSVLVAVKTLNLLLKHRLLAEFKGYTTEEGKFTYYSVPTDVRRILLGLPDIEATYFWLSNISRPVYEWKTGKGFIEVEEPLTPNEEVPLIAIEEE